MRLVEPTRPGPSQVEELESDQGDKMSMETVWWVPSPFPVKLQRMIPSSVSQNGTWEIQDHWRSVEEDFFYTVKGWRNRCHLGWEELEKVIRQFTLRRMIRKRRIPTLTHKTVDQAKQFFFCQSYTSQSNHLNIASSTPWGKNSSHQNNFNASHIEHWLPTNNLRWMP